MRVRPQLQTITIQVFNNLLRYGKVFASVHVAERSVPKVVEKLIVEIERLVSDATKKRRILAYTSDMEWEDREDVSPHLQALKDYVGEGVLKRLALPDDPSPEQASQALDRVQAYCYPKGQRVRVKDQRFAGRTGVVVSAGANSCYVALDDYVAAGDPDPFRFGEDELEPIYEAKDVDEPEPYLAALDYITPLESLGYRELRNPRLWYRNFYFPDGGIRIEVEPKVTGLPDYDLAALIHIDRGRGGLWFTVQRIIVPSVFDILEIVRELEQFAQGSHTTAEFVDKVRERRFRGTGVTPVEEALVEETLDLDAPDPYVQGLQWEADTVNAFREQGVRMRRPKGGPTRPYYTLFWIPSAVTCCSYDLWLTPNADRSWSVEAEGTKTWYNAEDVNYEWGEEFVIDREWTIPAGATGDELKQEVQNILSDVRTYTGPAEPTIHEPDVDDIDEGVDDTINYDAYAKASAGYNPVQLLTAKDLRLIAREGGYGVINVYRSTRTTGWTMTLFPATDERLRSLKEFSDREVFRLKELFRQGIMRRLPTLAKMEQGMAVLDKHMQVYAFTWLGKISRDPENPKNWALLLDIQPSDANQRKRGIVVPEAQDTKVCAQCGGKCCKLYPGITSPEDWGAPDQAQMRQRIRAALNSGDYEFDDWFGDPTKESGGEFDVRMIRPKAQRRMGYKGEWDRCKLLKDAGCSLPYEQRPKQCRELAPGSVTGEHCKDQFSKQQAAIDWMPYQDLLRSIESSIAIGESVADPDDPQRYVDELIVPYTMGTPVQSKRFNYRYAGSPPMVGHIASQGNHHRDRHLFVYWVNFDNPSMCGYHDHDDLIPIQSESVKPLPKLRETHPDFQADPDFDAQAYVNTTYDSAKFLEAAGWTLHSTQALVYYTKTFPMPRSYTLGGMTFTKLEMRLGLDARGMADSWVSFFFVDSADSSRQMPVNSLRLERQQVYPWDYEERGEPPENYLDVNMPVRRFVSGIGSVLADVAWPESSTSIWSALSKVEQAVAEFIKGLNRQARMALHDEVQEAQDPDDPATVLQSQPGFTFKHTTYMGDMVFIVGPGEDRSDWPLDIGRVVQGPDHRWYVIGVRDLPDERLSEFGFGFHGKTFDTNEAAAMAIWLVRSRMPEKKGVLGKCRVFPPIRESQDPDAPEPYVQSLGTLDHVAALHGLAKVEQDSTAAAYLRTLTLHHPVSPTKEDCLYHFNEQPVKELKVCFIDEQGTDGRILVLFVRVPSPTRRPSHILWRTEALFSSEHEAAFALNRALTSVLEILDDRVEPISLTRVRVMLNGIVNPIFKE